MREQGASVVHEPSAFVLLNTSTAAAQHQADTCATVWRLDPAKYALRVAKHERSKTSADTPTTPDAETDTEAKTDPEPEPVCTELGRRLLRLQFGLNEWVLRRVEKVEFDHDSRVLRRATIELRVPEGAPQLEIDDKRYWLVPLSVMRRRTLVNLDLTDEQGNSIRMLGLRFTQALDQAMLRAAARIACGSDVSSLGKDPSDDSSKALGVFIQHVVSGDRDSVELVARRVAATRGEPFRGRPADQKPYEPGSLVRIALEDPFFRAALDRLWHNFTLFTLLPVELGRHRLIRVCVDEPTSWRNQSPDLTDWPRWPNNEDSKSEVTTYRPFASRRPADDQPFGSLRRLSASWGRLPLASVLGFKPIRIRFLTPSAENCTSYHFEFTAPAGVRITRATLLAGRPQPRAGGTVGNGVTVDDTTPQGPTAGLHAVEVPNGSLCRALIDLRVPAQGWLGTMLAAATACFLVVLRVWWHARTTESGQWSGDQVTNIVLLLVTVSAGSATYVAHQHPHEVAAKMVRGLRFVGAIMMAVPALLAVWLVYQGEFDVQRTVIKHHPILWGALICSGVCLSIVATAWGSSGISQLRPRRVSPWDLSGVETTERKAPTDGRPYREAQSILGFDGPAIGFYTAEGWHDRYEWDKDLNEDLESALGLGEPNATRCTCGGMPTNAPDSPTSQQPPQQRSRHGADGSGGARFRPTTSRRGQ